MSTRPGPFALLYLALLASFDRNDAHTIAWGQVAECLPSSYVARLRRNEARCRRHVAVALVSLHELQRPGARYVSERQLELHILVDRRRIDDLWHDQTLGGVVDVTKARTLMKRLPDVESREIDQ